MSTTSQPKIVDVVSILREGKKIILPEKMPYPRAIDILQREMVREEEYITVNAVFEGALPQEGAVAMFNVFEREFGYTQTPMFGRQATREVRVGINETVSVPWGDFEIPGVDGQFSTSATMHKERQTFQIVGRVRRKNETIFKDLVELIRTEIRENSIYKGKAWRLRTNDERGYPLDLPEPEFIELDENAEKNLSFPADVETSLNISLWARIEYAEAFRAANTSLRTGIVLAGEYGTGKSMTATVTALKAIRNGYTYIVCDRADELVAVARIAREYGPVVVFCEDIDRVSSGDRNISMDELLNVVDGIESKDAELILVFTTNDLDSMHEAMTRPGRIDSVITLRFPDVEATEKLLRIYAGAILPADEDISRAAEVIANKRTSAVAEVAKRAIAAAIWANHGVKPDYINGDNLYYAAVSVVNQLATLEKKKADRDLTPIERAAQIMVKKPNGHDESMPILMNENAAVVSALSEMRGNDNIAHEADSPGR